MRITYFCHKRQLQSTLIIVRHTRLPEVVNRLPQAVRSINQSINRIFVTRHYVG